MAGTEDSRTTKLSIQDLPDELMVKIFSNISVHELDNSVSRVCQRWCRIVKDKYVRGMLDVNVQLDAFEERFPHERLRSMVMKYNHVQHIKVWVEDLVAARAEVEKTFFQHFPYRILPLLTNITALHMDACLELSLKNVCITSILSHPVLKKLTVANRGVTRLDLIANDRTLIYGRCLTVGIYGICKSAHSILGYGEYVANFFDLDFLKRVVRNTQVGKQDCNFSEVYPEVSMLLIKFNHLVLFEKFSRVVLLKSLFHMVVIMDYNFTRTDLVTIFENSSFVRIHVKVVELKSKGENETRIFKNGRIKVCFTSVDLISDL